MRRSLAGKVLIHGGFVEGVGFTLNDLEGPCRAMTETGAETVALDVAHQLRLAVNDRDGALGARRNAVAAAVAQRFVDLNDFPNRHSSFLRYLVAQHGEQHSGRLRRVERMGNTGGHANDFAGSEAVFRLANCEVQPAAHDLN